MMLTTLPRSRLTNDISGWQGGNGPELILIHGVGLNADAWIEMLPYLQSNFSITVIDMPAHGETASVLVMAKAQLCRIIQGGSEACWKR